MSAFSKLPSLYSDYAEWWTLLSHPSEYEEEAGIFKNVLLSRSEARPVTLLELGSGGGNNAFYLKSHFQMTLSDISRQMLRVSQRLNPECIHLQGDMRTIRLNQFFDCVFVHDAIDYMTTKDELRQAIATAFIHCRDGGIALFVPDWTKENFEPSTEHGGNDDGERGLRYLSWNIDHNPNDNLYSSYMVYLLKEGETIRESPIDEHVCGLFPEDDWMSLLEETGFRPENVPYDHSEFDKPRCMFIGVKTVRGHRRPPARRERVR